MRAYALAILAFAASFVILALIVIFASVINDVGKQQRNHISVDFHVPHCRLLHGDLMRCSMKTLTSEERR